MSVPVSPPDNGEPLVRGDSAVIDVAAGKRFWTVWVVVSGIYLLYTIFYFFANNLSIFLAICP
jgi:hypothetical protein